MRKDKFFYKKTHNILKVTHIKVQSHLLFDFKWKKSNDLYPGDVINTNIATR